MLELWALEYWCLSNSEMPEAQVNIQTCTSHVTET